MAKLRAVSLFSGCGGFDLGARRAGIDIIWANDIDASAVAAYRSLHPETEIVESDIREIDRFPEAEILIGCYPCTGFSVAARRKWHDRDNRDLRSNDDNFLYVEFLRALKDIRPKYLFVENVRGMLSASKGWFFEQQLQGFRDCGYDVYYKLLSADWFGVAQTRKRIFIVGVRRDVAFKYEFPEATFGKGTQRPQSILRNVIGDMPHWPEGEFFDFKFHGHFLTRNRKRLWSEPSYTIVANAHHVPLHPGGEPMEYVKKDTWRLVGEHNRRLSWRECAAIQDLPTTVNPSGTLHDKYRVVGNAVPPSMANALLSPILSHENSIS